MLHRAFELFVTSRNEGQAWSDAMVEFPVVAEAPSIRRLHRRFRRNAALLEDMLSAKGANAHPELELTAFDGALGGIIDLVIEQQDSVDVIDFKSGVIRDELGDVVKPYQDQILLYAALAREHFARPVRRGLLWSLVEPVVEIDVSVDRVDEAVGRAQAARAAYNALAPGTQPARPSPSTCRWCSYKAHCDPFWEDIDETWGEGLGSQALAGVVAVVDAASGDWLAVELDEPYGTTPEEISVIAGVPAESGRGLFVGARVRVSDLTMKRGATTAVRWSDRSQIVVE